MNKQCNVHIPASETGHGTEWALVSFPVRVEGGSVYGTARTGLFTKELAEHLWDQLPQNQLSTRPIPHKINSPQGQFPTRSTPDKVLNVCEMNWAQKVYVLYTSSAHICSYSTILSSCTHATKFWLLVICHDLYKTAMNTEKRLAATCVSDGSLHVYIIHCSFNPRPFQLLATNILQAAASGNNLHAMRLNLPSILTIQSTWLPLQYQRQQRRHVWLPLWCGLGEEHNEIPMPQGSRETGV